MLSFSSSACPSCPTTPLLEEWCINDDLQKFRRKLRVNPNVFAHIIQRIEGHLVFSNNSNNPQLGIPIQLAIFLNGVGHYGNGATTDDLAEWVGVSIGTVYNCFRRVMIALLQFHDDVIHFDPMELETRRSGSGQSSGLKAIAVWDGEGDFYVSMDRHSTCSKSPVGMVKGSSIINHNIRYLPRYVLRLITPWMY